MINPVLTKLIQDFSLYSEIFPDECGIPLDTHEWKDLVNAWLPMHSHKPIPESQYFEILSLAKQSFPLYHFKLQNDNIESPDALGPCRIWLKYTKK